MGTGLGHAQRAEALQGLCGLKQAARRPLTQTPERPKKASLFDAPALATPASDADEEEEILREIAEAEQIGEDDEELDDPA